MHSLVGRRAELFGDRHQRDEGFSLLEVIIAISISAIVFTAVAAILGSGLRTLTVQKARTQGNEVATQGMEDLQRYSFNSLAVCAPPPDPPDPAPAGFGIPVVAPSTKCPTAAATTGDDPCVPPATPLGVPKATYDCSRINITYKVRRYVAWTDAGRTAKRLAVFVKWTDLVGTHEVSQQSSLRAPVSGDIIGIDAPGFSAPPDVTPASRTNTIDGVEGRLTSTSIGLSAQTTGLTSADDRVFVSFRTLENGNLVTSSVGLTMTASNKWTGSIPSGGPASFPAGSQYLAFTAVRASDGKTGSIVDTSSSTFCPSTGCPPGAPTFSVTGPPSDPRVAQTVSTVDIDDTGAIKDSNGGGSGTVTITATTQNLTNLDSVNFQFVTKTGTINAAMVPDPTCSTTSCTWTATISRASGYGFNPGVQSMYFLAAQTGGATAAARSIDMNFVAS